jgi:hypothetical protein
VSHVALSGPPDVEHAELEALGAVVGVTCAAAAAVVVGAAATAEVVVGAGLVVVVDAVVVEVVFFAVGVELHAAATSATAPSDSTSVDQRRGTRRDAPPAWLSRARESAPRCTGSPLKA